jgi:hypothetical protein
VSIHVQRGAVGEEHLRAARISAQPIADDERAIGSGRLSLAVAFYRCASIDESDVRGCRFLGKQRRTRKRERCTEDEERDRTSEKMHGRLEMEAGTLAMRIIYVSTTSEH